MLFLFEEASKPLAEVNDIYREPLTLELPRNDSSLSIGSSLSSGRHVNYFFEKWKKIIQWKI